MDNRVETAIGLRMACLRYHPEGAAAAPPTVTHGAAPAGELCFVTPAAPIPALTEPLACWIRERRTLPVGARVGQESYVIKAAPAVGRLRGVVVAVTGSAQGFGRGIAEALAREGARVAIGDLNEPAGVEVAAALNRSHGEGSALFARLDVTQSASIQEFVSRVVLGFGGLDMLVSNAGVLRAGSLDELDEASFDLVTSVNYKGYFLCVKAVAPLLKLQHALHPAHFTDIIQINSKSGLEGSNKNFAYAGGKFGGIGLTQSFALELLPHNVKVNAICPGNYFDGPLWSDPEKGLFVQYLRAGKVQGAKTIDDVRQSYLSKIPMKRGCTPDDVATAILYLHEQKYETGQALPVTGGQVMLR